MTPQQSLLSLTKYVSADTIKGLAFIGVASIVGLGYLFITKPSRVVE